MEHKHPHLDRCLSKQSHSASHGLHLNSRRPSGRSVAATRRMACRCIAGAMADSTKIMVHASTLPAGTWAVRSSAAGGQVKESVVLGLWRTCALKERAQHLGAFGCQASNTSWVHGVSTSAYRAPATCCRSCINN